MVPLKKLLKPYRKAAACNSMLAPYAFVDENCFLTKPGHLGLGLALQGIDYESLTEGLLETMSARLLAALRSFDDEFRLYCYVLKHDGARVEIQGEYPNVEIADAVNRRKKFLEARPDGLYTIEIFWFVVYEPLLFTGKKPKLDFSSKRVLRILAEKLERDREYLLGKARSFQSETGDLLRPRLLDKSEIFTVFRRLVNLSPEAPGDVPVPTDRHIDYFLMDHAVAINPDSIQVGPQRVEVLSLKERPKRTIPNLFRELYSIPANFVLCTEFQTVAKHEATAEIGKAQAHFYWAQWLSSVASIVVMAFTRGKREDIVPDAGATSNVDELKELSKALEAGDELGQFSLTMLIHGPDRSRLKQAAAEATRVFGKHEASVFRETHSAFNGYLSVVPGNGAFNMRRLWMLQSNFADMALVYARSKGEARNAFLKTEYLFAAETPDRTIQYVNLHYNDVCNISISGVMGAGKSVLSNIILESLQKIGAHICILDIGGSYRQICRKYNGAYVHFDFEKPDFAINPFVLEPTRSNLRFLTAFVRLLLVNNEYNPTIKDRQNIYQAIKELYIVSDSKKRRLGNLNLSDELRSILHNWIGDGEDAWLFDNAHDTINISKFQVFDFQGADEDEYTQVLEPLLFYLFRRQGSVVHDRTLRGTFKMLWADEVWRFLANDTCRRKFIAAGKTYRKHNAGIGLVTQSMADLANAGLLELANEICPTKIWLHNPGADVRKYQEVYHWNEAEAHQFATLVPKRDFLLKKGDEMAQRLQLNLDPESLASYGNSPFENIQRDEAQKQHGFREGLRALAAQGAK